MLVTQRIGVTVERVFTKLAGLLPVIVELLAFGQGKHQAPCIGKGGNLAAVNKGEGMWNPGRPTHCCALNAMNRRSKSNRHIWLPWSPRGLDRADLSRQAAIRWSVAMTVRGS